MQFENFIKKEFKDRVSQKGIINLVWNIFAFPLTVTINYLHYRKWIKLLDHLGINEADFNELVAISVKQENVSLLHELKKYGEIQPSLHINEGYIIERNAIFIFPLHKPKNRNHFYTEIQEPIIISLSNSRFPYKAYWKSSTFTKITNIEFKNDWTLIKLKGEVFNNAIEIRINKKISLTNSN